MSVTGQMLIFNNGAERMKPRPPFQSTLFFTKLASFLTDIEIGFFSFSKIHRGKLMYLWHVHIVHFLA